MTVSERTRLHVLVDEARRQLNVCNACRYCEGYCAVYPALERRTLLDAGDIAQLANLCHDCRACFDACMYTAPHDFDINVPKTLSEVRLESYRSYTAPRFLADRVNGWIASIVGVLASIAIVLAFALAHAGASGLVADPATAASPYSLVPYPALLALFLAVGVWDVVVFAVAGRRFWLDVADHTRVTWSAFATAVGYAATLRHMRGGGPECYYPREDVPSPLRRHLHGLVAYGFGLCTVSTIAAGVLQDFLGTDPPYPVVSVPVVAGLAGGVALAAGCTGLLWLKAQSSRRASSARMTIKDVGLLAALQLLAITGLLTLFVRDTSAFGIVLVIHLAVTVFAFAVAPYSKFTHLIFRFLAIIKDNLEAQAEPK